MIEINLIFQVSTFILKHFYLMKHLFILNFQAENCFDVSFNKPFTTFYKVHSVSF